jgi:hypothetical protein
MIITIAIILGVIIALIIRVLLLKTLIYGIISLPRENTSHRHILPQQEKQKLGVHGACARLVTIMNHVVHSRRSIRFVLMLSVVFQAGCSVYNEYSHSQTGTFYPNGCVQIDGFKMDMIDKFVGANICKPVRIVSFGTMRLNLTPKSRE